MEEWARVALQMFTILVISVSFFGCIGFVAVKICTPKLIRSLQFYSSVLVYTTVGWLVSITGSALVFSSFRTVTLGVVFVGVMLIWELRKVEFKALPYKFSIQKLLGLLAFTGFIFIWQSSFFLKTGVFSFHIPFVDIIRYAEISESLVMNGVENAFGLNNLVTSYSLTPYHYFELWTTGVIAKWSGEPSVVVMQLVSLPFFLMLFATGLLAIGERYKMSTWVSFLLTFALLFLGGIWYQSGSYSIEFTTFESYMVPWIQKWAYLLPISTLVIYTCIIRQWCIMVLLLLLLSIMNIALAPAILGGAFFFIIVFIIYQNDGIAEFKRAGLYTILVGLFLAGFYALYGSNNHGSFFENIFSKYLVPGDIVLKQVKEVVYNLVHLIVNISLYLLGLLALSKINGSDNRINNIIILVGFVVGFGAVGYAFFAEMYDAFQFLQSTHVLVYAAIAVLSIYVISNTKSRGFKITAIMLLLLGGIYKSLSYIERGKSFNQVFSTTYSDDYIKSISRISIDKENMLGICIDGRWLDSDLYPELFKLGNYIKFMPQFLGVIKLDLFDSSLLNTEVKNSEFTKTAFFRFVLDQYNSGRFVSIEQSQLDFVVHHKVKFAVVSAHSIIPELISKRVVKQVVDDKSGERFLLLRN